AFQVPRGPPVGQSSFSMGSLANAWGSHTIASSPGVDKPVFRPVTTRIREDPDPGQLSHCRLGLTLRLLLVLAAILDLLLLLLLGLGERRCAGERRQTRLLAQLVLDVARQLGVLEEELLRRLASLADALAAERVPG